MMPCLVYLLILAVQACAVVSPFHKRAKGVRHIGPCPHLHSLLYGRMAKTHKSVAFHRAGPVPISDATAPISAPRYRHKDVFARVSFGTAAADIAKNG